ERLVCEACDFIFYENPVVVVGAVCTLDDRILLCRRAIEPRKGFWTIPAGYLELKETTAEGAMRETREEALAEIEIEALLAVYNIPRLSQVQIIYAARLLSPDVAPGSESLEVRLSAWDDIPWDNLAFPSVHWALDNYKTYASGAPYTVGANPPDERGDLLPT
ncbi:MAG: NUDIX domain-containing protein, partial [Alphaproteobacteria bacterium]